MNEDEFCLFGGGSSNRSDDAQKVRARPVAPIQSAPSQILLKKRKIQEFVGAGGKSSFDIDQCKSPKITLKRKSAPSDHHETDQLPIGPPPSGSSIAPVLSKSLGKRPLGEVEVETEVPGNTLATDHERARLVEEGPPHVRALVRGTIDLSKMFNLLSELGPPPASVVSDTNEEVATKLAKYLSYVRISPLIVNRSASLHPLFFFFFICA
nr:uncharacterized protein LOC109149872 [Ipomoea batatas]